MNNEIENQKVINTKLPKMLITTGFWKKLRIGRCFQKT